MNGLKIIKKHHKPLLVLSDGLLSYSRGSLYKLSFDGKKAEKIAKIYSGAKLLLSKFSLASRILRLHPRAACLLPGEEEKALVSLHGGVCLVDAATGEIKKEHSYRAGMSHPLSFAHISGIEGFEDRIVYGEYFQNPDREEVRIFGRDKDGEWKTLYAFSAHSVKHIHLILPDRFHSCVWVFTGDSDSESGIFRTRDDFATLEEYLVGSESYRGCVGAVLEGGLLFVTDTPDDPNKVYFIKHSEGIPEEKPRELWGIEGSCIYGVPSDDGGLYFSTAVEYLDRGKKTDVLSYKRAKAIEGWTSGVYYASYSSISRIAEFRKDVFPMGLCGFGTFSFVGSGDRIYAYGRALKGASDTTFLITYKP